MSSAIAVGATIPSVKVKENSPAEAAPLSLTGKNLIVGVPGAFTGVCHAQIPGFIKNYDNFKAKGINEIFVTAVNDAFVTKAWKADLAPGGTPVRFIADDKAEFTKALGLDMDATNVLGGPRSQRFVIVTDGDKVSKLIVEPDFHEYTVTSADQVLTQL
ncbi:Redoxin [Pterulicium gracile]|uniref:Redoxin n=1 Tax=Pterulicium gracile TaxID=1884261 RepID=A0A5C3Q696_9AGAR|nr:Redoxin [Pterula gracilis]